jgi:hypothetical protein
MFLNPHCIEFPRPTKRGRVSLPGVFHLAAMQVTNVFLFRAPLPLQQQLLGEISPKFTFQE